MSKPYAMRQRPNPALGNNETAIGSFDQTMSDGRPAWTSLAEGAM